MPVRRVRSRAKRSGNSSSKTLVASVQYASASLNPQPCKRSNRRTTAHSMLSWPACPDACGRRENRGSAATPAAASLQSCYSGDCSFLPIKNIRSVGANSVEVEHTTHVVGFVYRPRADFQTEFTRFGDGSRIDVCVGRKPAIPARCLDRALNRVAVFSPRRSRPPMATCRSPPSSAASEARARTADRLPAAAYLRETNFARAS